MRPPLWNLAQSILPIPERIEGSYPTHIYIVSILTETTFTDNDDTEMPAYFKVCVSFILLHLQILAQDFKQSWDSLRI